MAGQPDDRALRALSTAIWGLYDDRHEHTMSGRYALTPEGYDALTRFALFADSDLPYEWPQDDFVRIAGLGWRVIVLASLLSFAVASEKMADCYIKH